MSGLKNLNGKMMNYIPPVPENIEELLKTRMAVRFYHGPMSEERINELKNRYLAEGWKVDAESPTLWFVSECGRWFDGYNLANSQYTRLDGDWTVNLIQTKEKKDETGTV